MSKSVNTATEVAVQAVLANYEESEKLMYNTVVELASHNKENVGKRHPKKGTFNQSMFAEDSLMKEELEKARKERDSLAEEFATLENNYGDLFRRYEVLRENSQTLKDNETKLKREAETLAEKNAKLLMKMASAQEIAQRKLNEAAIEIDELNRARDTDNIALKMKVKQYRSQISALEATVVAKEKEVRDFEDICNELLQKADIGGDDQSYEEEY
uniref:TACC_C domain-containing protein n=1 Tax=Steinernema glaseri TaxID=37863 RepID=A0A1I7Y2G0_9BILA